MPYKVKLKAATSKKKTRVIAWLKTKKGAEKVRREAGPRASVHQYRGR